MSSQDELNDYVQKRPWALALLSVAFILLGISMWFIDSDDHDGYPYVSDSTADYVVAPLAILLGLGALVVAARRASRG